jgi:chromosome segregation ATPase
LSIDSNTITEIEKISLEEDIQNTVGLIELLHDELEQDKKDRSDDVLFYNSKLEGLENAMMRLGIENRELKQENAKITEFKQALGETFKENENLYTQIEELNEHYHKEIRLMNEKYIQAVDDVEQINDKLMQEQLKSLKYEEDITEYKENIVELKDALAETLEENEILCKREHELDGCIVDTKTIARAEKLLEYFQNLNIEFPEELKKHLEITDDMDTTGGIENEKDTTD